MHTSVTNWLPFFSTNGSVLIWGRRLSKLLLCELQSSTWYFLVSLFVQKRPQKYRKNGISNKNSFLKSLCRNSSVNNISGISVSILTKEDYPLFNHVAGKILRTVKPMTVTLEKWLTAIYIYRFPLNSTGCWVLSTLVVPPLDCHEKVNWFDDFASIHFSVYFGAHILKFAHDLIVIQFVDRYKQVKYSGIEHFGILKGDRIRYREETALYRSTLRNTYGNIFGELFSSRSI